MNHMNKPPETLGFKDHTPAPKQKLPLFRELPPAAPFPFDALAEAREVAEAVTLRTQAPSAMCAQSILAAITLGVQAHRDVELPGGGKKPLTGLFASIAESGERKTSVDRLALAPVYAVEAELRRNREAEMTAYHNDLDAWKAAREAAKKAHKGDRAAIRTALDAVGAEPRPPRSEMLLVDDPSPEALVLHLRDGRSWCGVFTSEGGILVGGHAFTEEKAMQTGALFNTLWDGAPIRRTRVLTGTAYLPGRRCSTHIMMQRVVADRLLGDSMLDGIGMMARMLIVAPESTIGYRPFRESTPLEGVVLATYHDRLKDMLLREPQTAPDAPDVLTPEAMTFTDDAKSVWVAFYNAVEKDLAPGQPLHSIKGFGAKLAEHAGRLAAVLAAFANPESRVVDRHQVASGIVLAQHYAGEMLRMAGAASVSPELRLAHKLLTWWQARPAPEVHLATIYQRGPHGIEDGATARRVVGVLEQHGLIERLPPDTEIDGVKRRDAWVLVP